MTLSGAAWGAHSGGSSIGSSRGAYSPSTALVQREAEAASATFVDADEVTESTSIARGLVIAVGFSSIAWLSIGAVILAIVR